MFEKTLKNAIQADTEFPGYVTTFEGEPAIFAVSAPEKATVPYLAFAIRKYRADASVDRFIVDFDFFDYGTSRANCNAAMNRLDVILDEQILPGTDARYDSIRMFMSSGEYITTGDSRNIRYNVRYDARAGRKYWMSHI